MDELKSPPVSRNDRESVVNDGEPWMDELTSTLVSILDSSSVLGNEELRTGELTSLALRERTSLVEVLKTSELDEEATTLDESGISIGVVTGSGILSLLGIEAGVSNSLLSDGVELDSSVELMRAGLVVSDSTLLSLDKSRPEDDESSGGLKSEEGEADEWDSTLLDSVVSASLEEYDNEGSSEGSSEVVDCSGL